MPAGQGYLLMIWIQQINVRQKKPEVPQAANPANKG
jgi:hypothetical protein